MLTDPLFYAVAIRRHPPGLAKGGFAGIGVMAVR